MKLRSLLAAAMVSATSAVAANLKSTQSVQFTALGPAGFKIVGTTTKLTMVSSEQAVRFLVPLEAVETGITLRDKHMRDYLEVTHFPQAVLELPAKDLPAAGKNGSGDLQGTFTVHGVAKPVSVHYELTNGRVVAKLNINFVDHGVKVPSYMGITVKPTVAVEADFAVTE
jgi:polyisoprenoid-binding protein YceI